MKSFKGRGTFAWLGAGVADHVDANSCVRNPEQRGKVGIKGQSKIVEVTDLAIGPTRRRDGQLGDIHSRKIKSLERKCCGRVCQ